MVAGLGRKGHAVGDIPGVRYFTNILFKFKLNRFKIIAVKGISLLSLYTGKREKKWSP